MKITIPKWTESIDNFVQCLNCEKIDLFKIIKSKNIKRFKVKKSNKTLFGLVYIFWEVNSIKLDSIKN